MPTYHLQFENPAQPSFRAAQVAGMFGLEDPSGSRFELQAELPSLDEAWQIGAIVGPSGSGKTSLALAAFGSAGMSEPEWPRDRAVVDAFPESLPMRRIVEAFGAVGFHTPPAWLRPYRLLSQGEQFRCRLALALLRAGESSCSETPLLVCDEFTSAIDRDTARSASFALARAIRSGQIRARLVAISCHSDVLPWLAPDWSLDLASNQLTRGLLRRPSLTLEVARVRAALWSHFRRHHYLASSLNPAVQAFAAFRDDRPIAFSAWMRMGAAGHQRRDVRLAYREHRTVVLPEFQGLGIGNRLSEWCASLFRGLGHRAYSATSHPAMIGHRLRSPSWRKVRLGFGRSSHPPRSRSRSQPNLAALRWKGSFEYIGPALDRADAARLMVR